MCIILLSAFGLTFMTHGVTHMAICFLIILVLLLTDRSYIRIGTIICMVCGGPIIDGFTWLLSPLVIEEMPFIATLIFLAIGCVILAFGMTLVIKSEAGTGPNDLISVVISDKSRKPFGLIRIITDFSFVLLGAFPALVDRVQALHMVDISILLGGFAGSIVAGIVMIYLRKLGYRMF